MKKIKQELGFNFRKIVLVLFVALSGVFANAQTNVFDNIIATSPDHTILKTALQQEGLDIVLKDSTASYTVFAPTNTAFDSLASALGTNVSGLLALPNLADILKYHVLGTAVNAAAVTNGAIVTPLNPANTIKLTKTSGGLVYANQAKVTTADLTADNGIVHVVDAVLLPKSTVVDIAINNGFTSLTAAVVKAELLPALTNPLAEFTVFAPTNTAFDSLATALGTDLNGLLASPNLANILLYHVVSGKKLSSTLTNGNITTLLGQDLTVNVTSGVKINNSTVTLADLQADNGVVHVIDAVLIPATLGINEAKSNRLTVYPNPTSETLQINDYQEFSFRVFNLDGKEVLNGKTANSKINISSLRNGSYILLVNVQKGEFKTQFTKM